MHREYIKNAFAVSVTAARENPVTENDFFAIVVKSGTINKQPLLVRLLNGPAAETTRHLLHVFLRVTAIDAQRMQLHQLARVIFVEATVDSGGLFAFGRIRTRHARPPVVEVEEHRRRVRGGAEQIAKTTHRKWPNRFAIECRQ